MFLEDCCLECKSLRSLGPSEWHHPERLRREEELTTSWLQRIHSDKYQVCCCACLAWSTWLYFGMKTGSFIHFLDHKSTTSMVFQLLLHQCQPRDFFKGGCQSTGRSIELWKQYPDNRDWRS